MTLLEAPWANRDAQTDVCWPHPKLENGYALSLEGPGLGTEFDEEWVAFRPFVPSLQGPHLRGPRRRGAAECAGWVGAGFLAGVSPLRTIRILTAGTDRFIIGCV